LDWLKLEEIPIENEQVLKVEMLSVVSKRRSIHENNVADEMAKAQNTTRLRLPPYHGELNPADLIRAQHKEYVATHNKTFRIMNV
jgi:transposase